MIVDTSILIEFERRDVSIDVLTRAIPRDESLLLTPISISEMVTGALLADTEARRRRRTLFLEGVMSHLDIIAFGEREARVHAHLYVELRRAGTPMGERDLLIAATAVANGHSVMTRNVREFERVAGLTVVPLPGS